GLPSPGFSHPGMPGQGVCRHLSRLGLLAMVLSPCVANATPDRTSGACFLMHYDRHWLHSDREGSETPFLPLLSSMRRLGMRPSPPSRRSGSNIVMSHAD